MDNQTVEESGQRFDQSLFFNDNSKFYNWVNSKYFASILYKFDSLKVVDTADPDDFTDDEYFRQWCSEKNEDNIIQNNVKSNKDKPPCTKWAIDIIYNHLSYERNIDLKVNFKEGFFGGNSIRNWNDKFIKKDFSKDEEFGCMVFDFQNSREAWDKELKLRNQKVQKNLDKFMKKYGLALAE